MTTTERTKIDARISCALLELSILHVALEKGGRVSAAALIEGSALLVGQAQKLMTHPNYQADYEDRVKMKEANEPAKTN